MSQRQTGIMDKSVASARPGAACSRRSDSSESRIAMYTVEIYQTPYIVTFATPLLSVAVAKMDLADAGTAAPMLRPANGTR